MRRTIACLTLALALSACDSDPAAPATADPCVDARAEKLAQFGPPTRKAIAVDKGKYTETWQWEDSHGNVTLLYTFQWGGGIVGCSVNAG